MCEDKYGNAVAKLAMLPEGTYGTVCDFLDILASPGGLATISKIVHERNSWMDLLKPTESVECSGIDSFFPIQNFRITEGKDRGSAETIISSMSNDFMERFIEMDGKEKHVAEDATYCSYILKRTHSGKRVMKAVTELNGGKDIDIPLPHVFELIRRQGRGQEGPLLIEKHRHNVFPVRDYVGVLWPVYCVWSNGWDIEIIPIALSTNVLWPDSKIFAHSAEPWRCLIF